MRGVARSKLVCGCKPMRRVVRSKLVCGYTPVRRVARSKLVCGCKPMESDRCLQGSFCRPAPAHCQGAHPGKKF